MKNIFTIALTALAVVSAGQIASAYDQDEENSHTAYQEQDHRRGDENRGNWNHDGGRRLDWEVNHLNRMLNHVEREMRRYGANRHIWREYRHVRDEARQLNFQLSRSERYFDRRRAHGQIEHMRYELHHIEQELRARANEWYQWR